MTRRLSLVVFISGNGSNLQSIVDALEANLIDASISAVVSNNPAAYGLQRARKHNLITHVIDHRIFDSRESFDQALLDYTGKFNPDYIVLAGFMRILSSAFIQAHRNTILNIHPSLLPAYKGLNTYQRALQNCESEHGVSIHVVTAELDDGPVLLQGRYAVEATDTVTDLQQKGHNLEHRMYPLLLKWLAEGRLEINHDSVIFDQQVLRQPLDYGHYARPLQATMVEPSR